MQEVEGKGLLSQTEKKPQEQHPLDSSMFGHRGKRETPSTEFQMFQTEGPTQHNSSTDAAHIPDSGVRQTGIVKDICSTDLKKKKLTLDFKQKPYIP